MNEADPAQLLPYVRPRISTLALGSIVTFAAIVAGSALTMKVQCFRMIS